MTFTTFINNFYKNEKDLDLLKFSRHISYIILHYLKQKKQARRIQLAQMGSEDTPSPFTFIIYHNYKDYTII